MSLKKKRPKPVRVNNHDEPSTTEQGMEAGEADFLMTWPKIEPRMLEALASGHWMLNLFHLNGTDVRLWWMTREFLSADFMESIVMLARALRAEQDNMDAKGTKIPLDALNKIHELIKAGKTPVVIEGPETATTGKP